MNDLITVSKEDYLKAILESESEGKTVIPALLAHWLSVSAPAVTMAVKRLKRDGYVEVKADGIVRLTPKGRETATHTACVITSSSACSPKSSAWSGMRSTTRPSILSTRSHPPLKQIDRATR